jgi:CheY-like chemotaxis protein
MAMGSSILIVEDDRTNREAMARLACHAGFDVDTASTLAEAWAKLPANGCILLDIVLPDGRGLDLLRHIREEKLPIHVAIVSGSLAAGDLEPYDSLRPDAVFVKPVKPDDVLHWLGSHCPAKAQR